MIILCFLLAVGCLYDYWQTRIPNWLILLILLYGLGYRYWDAGGAGVFQFIKGCIAVLLVFYPLFKIGALGAGDVKLFASVAGYLSGQTLVCFLFTSLLIAAVISLVLILREKSMRKRIGYLCAYLADVCRRGDWQPYGSSRGGRPGQGVRLAGPVLLSVLVHMGGIY